MAFALRAGILAADMLVHEETGVILHPKTGHHFAPESAFKTGQGFCLISFFQDQ
jgi:hypothetical protein